MTESGNAMAALLAGAAWIGMHAAAALAGHNGNHIWINTTGSPNPWFDIATHWTPQGQPGPLDHAVFDRAGTYEVWWDSQTGHVTNRSLTLSAGNITFRSAGGPYTYTLSLSTMIRDGANLTLGRLDGSPHNLQTDGPLVVRTGSTLTIRSGSQATAGTLRVGDAEGAAGLVQVLGAGSTLNITGTGLHRVGLFGATGNLILNNGAGASIAGPLLIGESSNSGTRGTMWVLGGSTLTAAGLSLGSSGLSGQRGAIHLHDAGSQITQSGASTLVVGASANSEGVLTIGTSTADASTSFTTGTGNTTINATGTIDIGGDLLTRRGRFNANGNVILNGGTLNRGFFGLFNLAAGRTLTASNGATVNFTGSYTLGSGNTFTIQGGSSFTASGFLDIATTPVSNGTLIISGSGSSLNVTTTGGSWMGSFGSSATLRLENEAEGRFAGALRLADTPDPGSTAAISVLSGSRLTAAGLFVGTGGGEGASGTINVQDAMMSQSGGANLVLGAAAGSTGVLNVGTAEPAIFASGARDMSTSTGSTIVHPTGRINVGGGTGAGGTSIFFAQGPVWLNGGQLHVGSQSFFRFEPRLSLHATDGARATFDGHHFIGEDNIHIFRSGSVMSVGGNLALGSGLYFESPNGALTVEGPGSRLEVGGSAVLGPDGSRGQIMLRDGAAGTIAGDLHLFHLATVDSGASLSVGGTLGVSGVLFHLGGAVSASDIDLYDSGQIRLSPGRDKVLRTDTLQIDLATGSYVDLSDNAMIIQSADLATIRGYIASARTPAGDWSGPGLTSSAAGANTTLGYGTAAALGLNSFMGHGVGPSAVLVRYTLFGDANLDGRVDGEDFLIWQANFGTSSGATWTGGDFNGDGRVDGEDFLIWQANFGSVISTGAITPEPGAMGLLVLAGTLLRRRCRRPDAG